MGRKRNNPHKNFMVFNAVLFIAVLVITGAFLYLSFVMKRDANKVVTHKGQYHIEISNNFAGEDLSIYVNDSLLMNQIMPDTSITLCINRFAEEHALMIVNNATDTTTPFNLSKEGGKIIVKKQKGEITIDETPTN